MVERLLGWALMIAPRNSMERSAMHAACSSYIDMIDREANIAAAVNTGLPCQPDPINGSCLLCGTGPCSGGPRRTLQ